jgi:hypothetical protein
MLDCGRRPYATAEEAREAAAREAVSSGHLRDTFLCSWCQQWHLGKDPGRIEPCKQCGALIAFRGVPSDPIRLRPHNNAKCRAIRGPIQQEPREPKGKGCRYCKAPINLVPQGAVMVPFDRETGERHRCEGAA